MALVACRGSVIVAAVVLVWKRRPSGFVLVWFFAVLSPTLFIPMPKEELAERRLYVPLAAMIPLVVAGAFVAWQRFSKAMGADKRLTIAGFSLATGLLAAVYGTVTYFRLEAFQTELSIWEQAARYQPHDPLVQVNYGTALAQIGQREKAMQQFEKTLLLDPNHPCAHFNLGNALADKSQFEEAIPHFQKAVAGEPDDFFARFNLGERCWPSGGRRRQLRVYAWPSSSARFWLLRTRIWELRRWPLASRPKPSTTFSRRSSSNRMLKAM